jgi:hypothetical protein
MATAASGGNMRKLRFTSLSVVTLVLGLLTCVSAQKHSSASGRISPAPTMHDARADHTATLLKDGTVLITGGMVENGVFLNTAELFNPKTGAFESLPNMNDHRAGHSATLLPDGRVVIAGGISGREMVSGSWRGLMANSIDVYDPHQRRFTRAGTLQMPRESHAAIALPGDRVLFLGGVANDSVIASVEVFDLRTGKTFDAGTLSAPRDGATAVRLRDGTILLAGGSKADRELNPTIELYDPAKQSSRVVGQLHTPRRKHATVLLGDGRVLIIGGSNTSDWTGQYASAEIFDPRRGTSTEVANMAQQRFKITNAVAVLKDGTVLVAGGKPQAERFNPADATFSPVAGTMDGPHYFGSATLLPDGRVLVAGGYGNGGGGRGPQSTRESWLFVP